MADPPHPLVKNPDRVPELSQVVDPVGTAGGRRVGVTITKSFLHPGRAQVSETESTIMSEKPDVVDRDGLYQDDLGNQFQYRKDQVLGPGELKKLKRVGDFPKPQDPGEAELAATKADVQPENKMAQKPEDKSTR